MAAARIAEALSARWEELDLAKIVVTGGLRRFDPPIYELLTRRGVRVVWGRQALRDEPGQPTAEEKAQRLFEHVSKHGSLSGIRLSELPRNGTKPDSTSR